MSASNLIELLRAARASGRLIDALPDGAALGTLDDAYAVASRLAEGRGAIGGWKIGATGARGQAMLGLNEPFFGRIFSDTIHAHPARVRGPGPFAIEPEIGFIMARNLLPRADEYTVAEVSEAIGAIAPALEINRPSWRRPFEAGGLAIIADNGVNAGACVGEQRRDWRSFDLANLTVAIVADGGAPVQGVSSAVLGNPLTALTWLANALLGRGQCLKAGQVVLSGAMTPPIDVASGGRVRADFSGLGEVVLEI